MGILTIGIVSISSVLNQASFVAGTNALAEAGFRVKVAPNVAAGAMVSAAERARLLEQMWLDSDVDLLLFARGGEGAADVVPLLDWDKLRARPDLPVLGFSDVTILLNAMLAKGVGHPISGPMLSYATRLTPEARDWLRAVLEGVFNGPPGGRPLPPVKTHPLAQYSPSRPLGDSPLSEGAIHGEIAPLREGGGGRAAGGSTPCVASGLPMGGHVTRLHWLWEHGLAPSAAGRIVFLECTARHTAETVIDELGAMRAGGFFDGAAAVVLCNVRHEGDDRAALDAFFPSFAAALSCPVFSGFPYGHIPGILALDFRREASIAPDGTLSFAP